MFPWIFCDYKKSKEQFKLWDKEIYRDLSKPIGALNEKRLEHFEMMYQSFDDPEIPKFHYGSHYSNSGIVLYYLIRMEPFTSHFLKLQGGKWDHADRMFDSVERTWENVMTNTSDVKELIPEFYYLPHFLQNLNRFDLGKKQTGRNLFF